MMKSPSNTHSQQLKQSIFNIKSSWSQAGIGTCIILEQNSVQDNNNYCHTKTSRKQKHDHRTTTSAVNNNDTDVNTRQNKTSIQHHKKQNLLRFVLDLGCTPIFDQTIDIDIVLISHGHLDHIGAIFNHARAYNSIHGGGSTIPTYYVPAELVPKLKDAINSLSDLDNMNFQSSSSSSTDTNSTPTSTTKSRPNLSQKMNIIPMYAGQEVELVTSNITTSSSSCSIKTKPIIISTSIKSRQKMKLYLHPFHVSHIDHPSLGYTIISRTETKYLKEQYTPMTSKEIGLLVKQGIDIFNVEMNEEIQMSYTGDTSVDGLCPCSCCNMNKINNHDDNDDNDTLSLCPRCSSFFQSLSSSSPTPSSSYKVMSEKYLKEAFQSPLILCELTFLSECAKNAKISTINNNNIDQNRCKDKDDSTKILAKERGHLHISDLETIFTSHGWNLSNHNNTSTTTTTNSDKQCYNRDARIVFYHLSRRYGPAKRMLQTIFDNLSSTNFECTIQTIGEVMISSFIIKNDNDDDNNDDDGILQSCVKENGCISLMDYIQAVSFSSSHSL